MKIVTNLIFSGQCREAFEFYAAALGGRIAQMVRFGDAPAGARRPDNYDDKIMHAWLDIGDQALMGCDAPPARQAPMSAFSVAVHSADVEEARRIFEALAQGVEPSMPFGAVPWSPGFGMLTDRFGTPWIVNVTPEP